MDSKRCQIYIYNVKKRTFLGVNRQEKIHDKDNETSVKKGGVIEIKTAVLPLRDARSFAFVRVIEIKTENFSLNTNTVLHSRAAPSL